MLCLEVEDEEKDHLTDISGNLNECCLKRYKALRRSSNLTHDCLTLMGIRSANATCDDAIEAKKRRFLCWKGKSINIRPFSGFFPSQRDWLTRTWVVKYTAHVGGIIMWAFRMIGGENRQFSLYEQRAPNSGFLWRLDRQFLWQI